jgi:very-short-patch-repair endonuclease
MLGRLKAKGKTQNHHNTKTTHAQTKTDFKSKFRRQHGAGKYIVDFYCAQENLVIELEYTKLKILRHCDQEILSLV